MKKSIVFIIILIMMLVPKYSALAGIDFVRLGSMNGPSTTDLWPWGGGVMLITTMYCKNGAITKWYFGGSTFTTVGYNLNGGEDGPGYGKISVALSNNGLTVNSNENVYAHLYDANGIVNSQPLQSGLLIEGNGINHNLNVGLKKGIPYIIVFRNQKGSIVDVQKMMLSE